MIKTTVDFLRHGEVLGENYYRGITDDPLSPKGWQQLEKMVINHSWDRLLSSPLSRCAQFAEYISLEANIPLTMDATWQEINFGEWEGKMAADIEPSLLMRFYQDPYDYSPAGAESYIQFVARIKHAWEQLLQHYPNQHILVITHAGVIRCLFHILLSIPANKVFNVQVNHASLTQFECIHDRPAHFISLNFHNIQSLSSIKRLT